MNYKNIYLKKGREESLQRAHLWIFSGAIMKKDDLIETGDLVQVLDYKGVFLTFAFYSPLSIALRLINGVSMNPLERIEEHLKSAKEYREKVNSEFGSNTNMFRLIHGEGDYLPGLVVDKFGDNLVVEFHHQGFYKIKNEITAFLKSLTNCTSIFYKTEFDEKSEMGYLHGSKPENIVFVENDVKFKVDWEEGQKTGFFLDQRVNRMLLQKYSAGKTILNLFCYTGGFSMSALHASAKKVVSVDSSAKAINLAIENAVVNGFEKTHEAVKDEVNAFLNTNEEDFDVIIVDPPAFAKSINKRHNALIGYKNLNEKVFKKAKPGTIVFTFSCSQVMERQLFIDTIRAAAISAGKNIRIMHHLGQSADHPINLCHPESEYLKGLALFVE